ncbi:MAG TPA: hypothetical protein VIM11_13620 [Tepidisphaeraceae bacterium]|jgi:hypothetical protein
MRVSKICIKPLVAGLLLIAGAGCQGRSTIPSAAHLEQQGAGGLSYTAHEPGNVYVLDQDKNEKVFEGRVNTGDQIVVKPDQDQIVLAGNAANHSSSLKPDHHYAIYFDPQH